MAIDIPISEVSDDESKRNTFGSTPKKAITQYASINQINSDILKNEISSICSALKPEILDPNNTLGIDEVEVSLAVSAKTGVRLIGEASLATTASLKVKLKRNNNA